MRVLQLHMWETTVQPWFVSGRNVTGFGVTSGVRRKFPGDKFRHNRVTSQINFRPTIDHSRRVRGMTPGKFCKITPTNTQFTLKNTQITPKNTHLPLKIRILFIHFFIFRVWGGCMAQCPAQCQISAKFCQRQM